jgi:hypothetical protein
MTLDRVVLGGAIVGLAVSLWLHVAAVTAASAPSRVWFWVLHAGAMVGFWLAAGRVTAAGLRGVQGLLRIRRLIPIPVRLAVAAATLNALVAGGRAVAGQGMGARGFTAYWTMMYLLIAVLFAFVVLPMRAADGRPAGKLPGERAGLL